MQIDWDNLPHWDLCAALRPMHCLDTWARDASSLRRMRARHRLFVDQAITALKRRAT